MQERQRYEQEIAASREHIAAIERTGIIGQMSSMIAHELKQPLGAINNFGNGLLRRLHRGPVDPKVLEGALEEIVGQGTRASEIVDRVRGYAKHPDPVMQVLDMKPVLEKAAKEFHHIYPDAPPITLACLPYSWAEVDAWEIQLAVLNLLKTRQKRFMAARIRRSISRLRMLTACGICQSRITGSNSRRKRRIFSLSRFTRGKCPAWGLGSPLWQISPSAIKATPWRPRTPRSVTAA